MPITFTAAEVQKISDAMVERKMIAFRFQSGIEIQYITVPSPKWKVVVPGYTEKAYDTLAQAFLKAGAIEFAIIDL